MAEAEACHRFNLANAEMKHAVARRRAPNPKARISATVKDRRYDRN